MKYAKKRYSSESRSRERKMEKSCRETEIIDFEVKERLREDTNKKERDLETYHIMSSRVVLICHKKFFFAILNSLTTKKT